MIHARAWRLALAGLCLGAFACSGSKGTPGRRDASVIFPTDATVVVKDAGDTGTVTCAAPEYLSLTTKQDGTRLNVGWTGMGHGTPMPDNATFGLEIFDCDESCRTCRLSGPVTLPNATFSNQRCLNAPGTLCSSDADCAGGADRCRHFFNPATEVEIQLGDSTILVCARLSFAPPPEPIKNGSRMDAAPVQGSLDLVTGAMQFGQFTLLIQQGGCNTCMNDPSPADRNAGGDCGLPDLFKKCDAANVGEITGQPYSYDCDWGLFLGTTPGDSLGEFTLDVASATSAAGTNSLEWVLDEDSPNCGGDPTKKCFCGHCSDNTPCHTKRDCATGECEPNPGEFPNACETSGNIFVVNRTNCPTTGPNYDAETGTNTCSAQSTAFTFDTPWGLEVPGTSCFTDNGEMGGTLRARGKPAPFDQNGVSNPVMAALTCAPMTKSTQLNSSTGFPGPAVVELKFESRLISAP